MPALSGAPTLYVAVSAHGYGHIAQTAPVVNALRRRLPALRVVVESGAPREVLARRFDMPIEHVELSTDFGMAMRDALTVDPVASYERYQRLHAELEHHVAAACRRLEAYAPDILLANVPYVPLIAAKRLGIPSAALCSLDWAHIFIGVCGAMQGAELLHRTMLGAYREAAAFLAPEPSMEMPGLANVVPIGAIAEVVRKDRESLRSRLGVDAGARVVIVSMGGIATPLDLDAWPVVPGVTWMFDRPLPAGRSDMADIGATGMRFLEAMASSDAVITKPGYGTFAEAACNGVPVLYVPRDDWPEAPFLTRWLQVNARCVEAAYGELFSAKLGGLLERLWRLPMKPPVAASGVADAVDRLQALMQRAERRSAHGP